MRVLCLAVLSLWVLPLFLFAATESPRARFMRERLQFIEFRDYKENPAVSSTMRARAKEFFVRIHNRRLAAIARLEDIAGRIESRIGKIEASGGDMTRFRLKLASTRMLLQNAGVSLQNFQVRFENIFAGAAPAREVRTLAKDIESNVDSNIENARRGFIEFMFMNYASDN